MNTKTEITTNKKLGISITRGNITKYLFGNTVDELIDGLEVFKDGKLTIKFLRQFSDLSTKQLARLDSIICEASSIEEIVNYAYLRKSLTNVDAITDKLISLAKTKYDGTTIIEFASKVSGVDNKKLEDFVLSSNNSSVILSYCTTFKVVDKKFKEAILNCSDRSSSDLIDFFHLYIESGLITDEDINNLENDIIAKGKAVNIYYFVKYLKPANIDRLREAIYKTNATFWIHEFKNEFEPKKSWWKIFKKK